MNLTLTPRHTITDTAIDTIIDTAIDTITDTAIDTIIETMEGPSGTAPGFPNDGLGLLAATLTGATPASELFASMPATDADDEPGLSSYARCADGNGTLSFLFFSEDDLELARAKAICRSCGLQQTCLSGAIEREEPYGVWGGTLVLDGVPVEFKRKRGRPPKHPKPVLEVDEAPIPPHLVA